MVLEFLKPPVEFLFGTLAGVAILLLEQADELVVLAACPLQVVVRQFTPPLLDLAPHFLPLAFEYIFVHKLILQYFSK